MPLSTGMKSNGDLEPISGCVCVNPYYPLPNRIPADQETNEVISSINSGQTSLLTVFFLYFRQNNLQKKKLLVSEDILKTYPENALYEDVNKRAMEIP